MKVLFIILTLLLPLGGSCWASFSGQLKSSTDDYPYHLGAPTSDVVPYLSIELTEKDKIKKNLRFQARAFAITNFEAKSAPEKLYADLPEGFIEYKTGAVKLRAGMDTINWGVVDISSPSDVVNTQALFHPLRTYKRGAPMAEILGGGEDLNVHLIYIPVQQRPLLPSTDSRWLPRELLFNIEEQQTRILVPKLAEYSYDPPETLDRALNNNYGAKLASHVGRWDFQIMHFEGASPSPKARPTIFIDATKADAVAVPPIRLAPVTYRVRTTSAAAVWAREKWIWRAETAYQHTISRDPLLQPWMWTSVIAVETNVNLGSTTMTWLAQYYYTKNPQAPDNLISSSYRLFDHTLLLGTRWAYSEKLNILISMLYETQERGLAAMVGFDQKLTDVLKWGLTWHDFSAARDGLIKTYEHNDHATLDLIYYF